ncbi:MAG: MotA/TolQ/ExbB proton channel family protein [Verrucomicrobiota bacterium]|nr:MotA/TolQ/ExbB proton channel family protein [Verrucomicrobiota bacterium]
MSMLASNPFISAYVQSDWFGKGIFWSLFLLSVLCWIVLLYKGWQFWSVKRLTAEFSELFSEKKEDPLNLHFSRPVISRIGEWPHPLFEIYRAVKQQALQLISRRSPEAGLSEPDLELIESQVMTAMSSAVKKLEKHLFVLSMIVTLAPFLGLLGTVWGILLTFSQLPSGFHTNNAAMLSGLSMALATTVLGLLIAIPALVGHSYLKNTGRETRRDMEEFSHALLAAIEIQYRRGL